MKYIVDSNILIDYPQIVENSEDELIIPLCVLRELDGLKKNTNIDLACNARRAAIYISRNIEKLSFFDKCEKWDMPVDDKLIKIAAIEKATLLTNDVYLKVKATLKKIPTDGYSKKDSYSGIYEWLVDCDENGYSKELDEAIDNGVCPQFEDELFENQFIIAKNKNSKTENGNNEVLQLFKYDNGKLNPFYWNTLNIENMYINKIFPKNDEQACLFNILKNKDITVVYAGGAFGTGKSFILNNYALQELEKEHIKKIVYVPNNAFTENTMDIGALPGELLAKIEGQIGPLIDLVGIDRVQDMMTKEQLEIVPMNSIRGRSFSDSIIIVNEAQNLTEDHIKLLIGRVGEGTRIFFDGDIKQADSQLFRNKNGLRLLLNLRKSEEYSKLFATVKLIETVRSKTARCADYLDSII